MNISSFNINKFCGPYSYNGNYYNPRNIDFKNQIKEMVDSLLKNKEDIFFLQECTNNQYIKLNKLFPKDKYNIYCNLDENSKFRSAVVALTLEGGKWKKINQSNEINHLNKFIEMEFKNDSEKKELCIVSFHNTAKEIKDKIEDYFEESNKDVILGDFNDMDWIIKLHEKKNSKYRDLVTNDMITYKPGQTAVDRIFVNKEKFNDILVFNGIIETFLSDHNLLTFFFKYIKVSLILCIKELDNFQFIEMVN